MQPLLFQNAIIHGKTLQNECKRFATKFHFIHRVSGKGEKNHTRREYFAITIT